MSLSTNGVPKQMKFSRQVKTTSCKLLTKKDNPQPTTTSTTAFTTVPDPTQPSGPLYHEPEDDDTCSGIEGRADDVWCEANCYHEPPFCPVSHCSCTDALPTVVCSGIPGRASDTWCFNNCFHDPPYCPADFCTCTDETKRQNLLLRLLEEVVNSKDNYARSCVAARALSGIKGLDDWCQETCKNESAECMEGICECK